jgi:UDP-N-acetylglucosamine acyltransferase
VADAVTIANGTLLAGHVDVGPRAFISGNVVVHQFVRIGELAMIGGRAAIGRDVPPFMLAVERSIVYGPNVIGLRRAGVSADRRMALAEAHRLLYRCGLALSHAIARMRAMPPTPEVDTLIAFIDSTTRGLCGGRRPSRRREPH